MNDYSQPEFYKFNEDSIKLVRRVTEKVKAAEHILDLGAGSGIIGIELANYFHPESLTLVEVQKDYLPHLELNLKFQLKSKTDFFVELSSFGHWSPQKKYDLIVCNPPYFLPGHGEVSK